jgi:hypothetical protein
MNWSALEDAWLGGEELRWIGAAFIAAVMGAALLGLVLRVALTRRGIAKEGDSTQESYIVSGVVGLLALLLGFTFSLAVDRFDTRRGLVLAEANAMQTTYLRTQLLGEPHRTRISNLLQDYIDNRIVLAKMRITPEAAQRLARNNVLITELWAATVAAFPSIKGYDFSSSYLESMNSITELDAARKAARRAHVPFPVFVVLIIYQVSTAALLGYVMTDVRGRFSAAALMTLFTLALLLIIDIDRPTAGSIREDQGPIETVQRFIHAHPPGSFDRLVTPEAAAPKAP